MEQVARQLRAIDYFTPGFGTMVGVGWCAACVAYLRIETVRTLQTLGALGLAVGALLVLVKLLPFIPGHSSAHEWGALVVWIVAGMLFRQRPVREAASGR